MTFILYTLLFASIAAMIWAWFLRSRTGWEIPTYLVATGALVLAGATLILIGRPHSYPIVMGLSYPYTVGLFVLTLGGCAILFGVMEFVVLRLFGRFALGAITRVTYYEALLQPFTLILLFAGLAAVVLAAFMPYFTLNEESKMFSDVAVSLTFLFTLPIMIFSSTKVIDEEIENRTMLTLMSKPIARWQVVVGKYFGVLLLCCAVIFCLGMMAGACSYMRFFDDKRLDYQVGNPGDKALLDFLNIHALRALAPAILLQFLQIATLAAVSVAVSTRFGLAINITAVVILYVAANLTRYADAAALPAPLHAAIVTVGGILPGLHFLDLNQRLIFGDYNYEDTRFVRGLPSYSQIWQYVGLAAVYSAFYIGAALSFGVALFRTRELA